MENLYNKASLVLTPQMVETGKVYSMKPEDRKGDFTFSRSTYATRVGPTGLVEKETQNLLLQSNQFDTTWGSTRTNELSGYSGYDGSNDAWKIVGTDAADGVRDHYIRQSYSVTGVVTLSAYFKAAEKNWVRMLFANSPNPRADFDLNNGSVHNIAGNAIDAQITSVGSGWYRCSLTANLTAASIIQIYVSEGNSVTSWTGDDTSGIYIQDAQLEQGLVARDYIETTTTAIYGGITDNVPRLDYTDSSCPALLLEPQRTNDWKYSEPTSGAIGNINSVGAFSDINSFSSIGLYGGAILQGGATQYIYDGPSVANSTTYTFSCYMKTSDGAAPVLANSSGSASGDFVFIIGGAVKTAFDLTTYSITQFKGDIYKVVATMTSAASVTNPPNNGIIKFNTNRNADLEVTGLQWELGSYATSYIPTYGSAVTRNADSALQDSSYTFGSGAFSLFFEHEPIPVGFNGQVMLLQVNPLDFYFRWGSDTVLNIWNQEIQQSVLNTVITGGRSQNIKICMVYDGVGSTDVYVNGVKQRDGYSFTWPDGPYNIKLNSASIVSGNIPLHMNNIITFETALTDQEAIDLTTI